MANFNYSVSGTVILKRESRSAFEKLVGKVKTSEFEAVLEKETATTLTYHLSGLHGEDHGDSKHLWKMIETLPKLVARSSIFVETHLYWDKPNGSVTITNIAPNKPLILAAAAVRGHKSE